MTHSKVAEMDLDHRSIYLLKKFISNLAFSKWILKLTLFLFLFFLSFRFIEKFSRKYKVPKYSFLSTLYLLPTTHPHIFPNYWHLRLVQCICYNWWTNTDIVIIKVHTWNRVCFLCCAFYEFWKLYNGTYPTLQHHQE